MSLVEFFVIVVPLVLLFSVLGVTKPADGGIFVDARRQGPYIIYRLLIT
jgi:hypothetical protein